MQNKNKLYLIYFVFLLLSSLLSSCDESEANTAHTASTKDTLARKPVSTADSIKKEEPVAAPQYTWVLKREDPHLDSFPSEFLPDSIKKLKDPSRLWPVKTPQPLPYSILPQNRIVAFYGNLFSKKMGILGEYDKDVVLAKLSEVKKEWETADTAKPVIPALHLIAVTAQGQPGRDKKYRLRMPSSMIDTVLAMAERINGIVFLDVQIGHSDLMTEVRKLSEYLKNPRVHLGIDAEFAMKSEHAPGKKVGTYDADEVNECSEFLKQLVKENGLPPKVLIVHRFKQYMITNYKNIKKQPEVQIVVHMDGWGSPALKKNTWHRAIYKEPVEFTGFKIFYYNDTKSGHAALKPEDLLALYPAPVYVQYQ